MFTVRAKIWSEQCCKIQLTNRIYRFSPSKKTLENIFVLLDSNQVMTAQFKTNVNS